MSLLWVIKKVFLLPPPILLAANLTMLRIHELKWKMYSTYADIRLQSQTFKFMLNFLYLCSEGCTWCLANEIPDFQTSGFMKWQLGYCPNAPKSLPKFSATQTPSLRFVGWMGIDSAKVLSRGISHLFLEARVYWCSRSETLLKKKKTLYRYISEYLNKSKLNRSKPAIK